MITKIKLILTILTFILLKIDIAYSSNSYLSVDNVELKFKSDLLKEEILEKTYLEGFNSLISKVVLSKDYGIVKSEATKDIIKDMIFSYQITYPKLQHTGEEDQKIYINYKFNKSKVHNFLKQLNVSYSSPSNIDINVIPIILNKSNFVLFKENFFFENWNKFYDTDNNSVNFVLPAEDIDLINFFKNNINNINEINMNEEILNRENKNIALIFFSEDKNQIKVFLKSKILNNINIKNFVFKINSSNKDLDYIYSIKNIKENINDIWKNLNLIDLNIPINLVLLIENKSTQKTYQIVEKLKEIDIIQNIQIISLTNNFTKINLKYFGGTDRLKNKLIENNFKIYEKDFEWFISMN